MTSYTDYSVDSYGAMIRDQRRTGPFVEALRQAIQPGSVVLDIGTGTGIFAFLACQFGAARVYAIEPDNAIEVGRRCAKAIPGGERITWIQGLSTEMDLPERVDVVIGDLHGVLPFFKGNIESLADARVRHLKPGGRMIPSRDVLYAVPAQAPEEYSHVQMPWRQNPYGLDVSAGAPFVFNQWWRARSEPALAENLLSSPRRWGVVDYAAGVNQGLDSPLDWEIERPGTLHGLYVWFDGDLGDGVGYSNAPNLPEMVYGRAFFPFEQPTEVAPGDRLHVELTLRQVKGENVFRWKSQITSAAGLTKSRFDQSTFKATLINHDTLRKASADYVPTLNADGQVARAVLQAMVGERSLQQIADQLAVQFPEKFKTPDIALELASRLSKAYT
jgi:protein arginine N-methyltransferase 1